MYSEILENQMYKHWDRFNNDLYKKIVDKRELLIDEEEEGVLVVISDPRYGEENKIVINFDYDGECWIDGEHPDKAMLCSLLKYRIKDIIEGILFNRGYVVEVDLNF
jgi:hypothetical protein